MAFLSSLKTTWRKRRHFWSEISTKTKWKISMGKKKTWKRCIYPWRMYAAAAWSVVHGLIVYWRVEHTIYFPSYKCSIGKSNLRIVDSSQLRSSLHNDWCLALVLKVLHTYIPIFWWVWNWDWEIDFCSTPLIRNGFGRNNFKRMCVFSFLFLHSFCFVSNVFKSFLLHFMFKQREFCH